jgi:O-antigen/teichoic acid export membrane protein
MPPLMDKPEQLVINKRLTRNVMWNLLGTGLPLLVAIVAIPPLVNGMGTARFGVLTIAWMVVGYFSLFDLGLGRAMTKLVAERIGNGEYEHIPALVWAAMALMTILGVLGAVVISGFSPWLVWNLLEIPGDLRSETLTAFYLLAISIPIVISTTGLRGILEAHQRFGLVNIVRVPLGAITYLGPVAVLPYSNALPSMVLALVAARVVSWAAYFTICISLYPDLRRRRKLDPDLMRQLLTFGGWMTVSNVVGPLLLYLGRLLLAVVVSVEAVAYFSTPYEVVRNLLIIPAVFVSALFPAFSQHFQRSPEKVLYLYRKSMFYVLCAMLPLAVVTYLFAKTGLAWWINDEFSANGYRVAQFLVVGVFINSFGHVSQALIQAYGRPDLTAKLHVAEFIAYVPYLWWLTAAYGIDGAAVAWTIRVAISTLALYLIAKLCLSGSLSREY